MLLYYEEHGVKPLDVYNHAQLVYELEQSSDASVDPVKNLTIASK